MSKTPYLDAEIARLRSLEAQRAHLHSRIAVTEAIVRVARQSSWTELSEALGRLRSTAMEKGIQFGLADEERRELAAEARNLHWLINRPRYAEIELPALKAELQRMDAQILALHNLLPERG